MREDHGLHMMATILSPPACASHQRSVKQRPLESQRWRLRGVTSAVVACASVLLALCIPASGWALNSYKELAAGETHTCGVVDGGTVQCWGAAQNGQLGNGGTSNSGVPAAVHGISDAQAIAVGSGVDCRIPSPGTRSCDGGFGVGGGHSCVIVSGGQVKCWGRGDSNFIGGGGQLGNGTTSSSDVPVDVQGLTGATRIAAGPGGHTCAIIAGGAVRCWGNGQFGQLGNALTSSSNVPVSVVGLSGATAIDAGVSHTCALVDGAVKCWGYGHDGQLGTGGTSDSSTPVTVQGISNAKAISAGDDQSCALLESTEVKCWGVSPGGGGLTPAAVKNSYGSNLNGVTGITSGDALSCAIVVGGQAKCWGYGDRGQLGQGKTYGNGSPVSVLNVSGATGISSGGAHSCAVLSTGEAKCWGRADSGQLGTGTTGTSAVPVEVLGLAGATSISSAGSASCAVASSSDVMCWGKAEYSISIFAGVFSSFDTSSVPVAVGTDYGTSVLGASAVATGRHACSILTSGKVKCWGYNDDGELGLGSTNDVPLAPNDEVLGVSGATRVVVGGAHSCALVAAGAVKCWGRGDSGQLGDGASSSSGVPVAVQGVSGATDITAGSTYTCALVAAGAVKCWGDGTRGTLGNGGFTSSSLPVDVQGISGATDIESRDNHACALVPGGLVKCWGETGDPNGEPPDRSNTPIDAQTVVGATALTLGYEHSCALVAGGVKCWGKGSLGQLGNATTSDSNTPVDVQGIAGATSVAAGSGHSCALVAAGHVMCWGDAKAGQLGDASGFSTTPLLVLNSGGITPGLFDSDRDGVADTSDACPAVPAATPNGCPPTAPPLDSDADGVPDANDACPSVAAATADGCPAATNTGAGTAASGGVPSGGSPPVAAATQLASPSASLRVVGGKIKVICAAASGAVTSCRATLMARRKVIATATGRARQLTLKLNATGKKLLRNARGKKLTATLKLVAQTATGPVALTKTVKIKG